MLKPPRGQGRHSPLASRLRISWDMIPKLAQAGRPLFVVAPKRADRHDLLIIRQTIHASAKHYLGRFGTSVRFDPKHRVFEVRFP